MDDLLIILWWVMIVVGSLVGLELLGRLLIKLGILPDERKKR